MEGVPRFRFSGGSYLQANITRVRLGLPARSRAEGHPDSTDPEQLEMQRTRHMLSPWQPGKTAGLLVAACFALLGAAAAQAAPIKLEWKFVEGQKTKYRIVQDMVIDMDVAGQSVRMTMTQTMDLTWKVASVDEQGTADMTQTIDRLQMKLRGAPGADVSYDSDSDRKPEGMAALLSPMFEAIVKQPVKLKMSAAGKVSDVELPKEMSEKLKNTPGMGPLSNMFSEGNLKQMMGAGTLQFSPEAVDEGDEWQSQAEAVDASVGKQQTESTYVYQGLEDRQGRRLAKIGIKLNVKLAEDPDAKAQVSIEDQSSDGVAYFDPKASQIVDLKLSSKMKTSIDVMGQKLAQTVTNTTTMRPVSGAEDAGAIGDKQPE
jgi:hypothetical protein